VARPSNPRVPRFAPLLLGKVKTLLCPTLNVATPRALGLRYPSAFAASPPAVLPFKATQFGAALSMWVNRSSPRVVEISIVALRDLFHEICDTDTKLGQASILIRTKLPRREACLVEELLGLE
jgi:hypothetical protein